MTRTIIISLCVVILNVGLTPCCGQIPLTATVRDFELSHPNMLTRSEFTFNVFQFDLGIVLPELGADGKPVFNSEGAPFKTVTNEEDFNEWFNDVEGVNLSTDIELVFEDGEIGSSTVNFTPINGQLFGADNPDIVNNLFTMELHTEFTYLGGNRLDNQLGIESDDDLWVFVDGQLVIDGGGVHDVATSRRTVRLDRLGLTVGETYPIDVFYAERALGGYFRLWTGVELRSVPESNLGYCSIAVFGLIARKRRGQRG